MKNLIFVVPLALITILFIDGKSQADIKVLTQDQIDSMDLKDGSDTLPKMYYMDNSVKRYVDCLHFELKKTDRLEAKFEQKMENRNNQH